MPSKLKSKKREKEDKKKKQIEEQKKQKRKKTAQEWIPLNDINNNYIYRKDDYICMALKIEPINIRLFSIKEQQRKIASLNEAINGIKYNFQIIVLERPVDLDGYIGELKEKANDTEDFTRKRLLHGYMKQSTMMASSGDTLEKRFFIILWEENNKHSIELLKDRINELKSNLLLSDLKSEICDDSLLTSVLFNFTHPVQSAYERLEPGPYIPPIYERRD